MSDCTPRHSPENSPMSETTADDLPPMDDDPAPMTVIEPPKPGRSPTYGADDRQAVLDQVASGMTITAACKPDGMPSTTMVREWAASDIDGFAGALADARAHGADVLATEALDLSRTIVNIGVSGHRLVPAYRLRIDTLFRQAAALDPAAYGKQVKHSGTVGHAHAHAVFDAVDFLAPDVTARILRLRESRTIERPSG